ncbi:Tethering factor for nuclear proteasome sts1, partial [Cryomyces antarcticus]
MSSVIASQPFPAPHLLRNSHLSPSPSDLSSPFTMSGRKRKADDDQNYDRMSTSPNSSPTVANRPLPHSLPRRQAKRMRSNVSGRPLPLPRLLETLGEEDMRGLLHSICEQHPDIGAEVVATAPRPSVQSAISVLQRYEESLQGSFPFGNRQASDYAYNRVRQPLLDLLDAIKDFTPHFLPPNETQAMTSLNYLDAATHIIHGLPTWDTYQHNRHKEEAYDDMGRAWALVIREAAHRPGWMQLQYGGWEQKLAKHNEESGGRMQEAVNELRTSVGWGGEGSTMSPAAAQGDGGSIRQQL